MSEKDQKSPLSLSTAREGIQLLITIASVVALVAALWLTASLAPISQDIALIKQTNADQDRRIDEMHSDLIQIKNNTDQTRTDVAEIKGILKGAQSVKASPNILASIPASFPTPEPDPTPQTVVINHSTTIEAKSEPKPETIPTPEREEKPQPLPPQRPTIIDLPILDQLLGR